MEENIPEQIPQGEEPAAPPIPQPEPLEVPEESATAPIEPQEDDHAGRWAPSLARSVIPTRASKLREIISIYKDEFGDRWRDAYQATVKIDFCDFCDF